MVNEGQKVKPNGDRNAQAGTRGFTKRQVSGITLAIKGRDAWRPKSVYLFGIDTLDGPPSAIVPLVSVSNWDLGNLSEDTTEGRPSVDLPIS